MEAQEVRERLFALKARPILVASHQRSGTHLTIDVLRRQFAECDAWKWPLESNGRLYLPLESLFQANASLRTSERTALRSLKRCPRPLMKTHFLLDALPVGDCTCDDRLGRHWIDWLRERGNILYVHRDGREVMCSYYLMRYRRLSLASARGHVTFSEFLRCEEQPGISIPRAWAHHVERYLAIPGVLSVSYRDITKRTEPTLRQLGDVLGMTPRLRQPLLPGQIQSKWHSRLSRVCSVRPHSTAILSKPPEVSLPKWPEAMTRDDREFFHREAGDTLIKLGYENSNAWVSAD